MDAPKNHQAAKVFILDSVTASEVPRFTQRQHQP
jgi:hypothetical protein